MCRLFAVLANEPVRVDRAFAALQRQAVEHKDGWGVAIFNHGLPPQLEVSTLSASACTRFSELGQATSTRSLLAHIRLASVGGVREENSHPFSGNGFAFMHNGTLREFDKHRADFEALIEPSLRAKLRGETDSERCFALFLTFLGNDENPSLEAIARALAKVMQTAASVCDREDDPTKSAMNFMVTDGVRMVATRRGRTLFHAKTPAAHFVASEVLWPENEWVEVPENAALLIDSSLEARAVALNELLPRSSPLRE